MKDNAAPATGRLSTPSSIDAEAPSMELERLPACLTSREPANLPGVSENAAREFGPITPQEQFLGQPQLPQFLSVIEVAAVLRVDRKTVHKLIASGDLPHVRLGRVLRIPASVLQSLCKSA